MKCEEDFMCRELSRENFGKKKKKRKKKPTCSLEKCEKNDKCHLLMTHNSERALQIFNAFCLTYRAVRRKTTTSVWNRARWNPLYNGLMGRGPKAL